MKSARILKRAALAGLLISSLSVAAPSTAAPTQAELEAAEARLMEIEREFELLVERYNAVDERLAGIQHEMARTQLIVREIEQRMEIKEASAIALAVELYKAGPTGVAVEAVLSSESLADIETRVEYLRSSNTAQVEIFEQLGADRSVLDRRLEELDEQKGQALLAEVRLDELRSEVELRLISQEDEIARLNAALERAAARRAARDAAALAVQTGTFGLDGPIRPAPAPNAAAQAAVDAALSQIGKPYQWGAEGPDSYDCSGLMLWAWAHAEVALPRVSRTQYTATTRVPKGDWEPGDLLFFGSPIHHVAMYIGNGQMVEAPYTGQKVRVVSAMRTDYVGAGRPGV
ncbi:MAG: NlpC/P60 family protein [Actinomycetota bacterium]